MQAKAKANPLIGDGTNQVIPEHFGEWSVALTLNR